MMKQTFDRIKTMAGAGIAVFIASVSGIALAALPAPTPEQAKAAAAKKEQAAAQTAKEKQELTESMDKIAGRWRSRAGANGWKTHPPVPVAAAPAPQASASPPAASAQQGSAAPQMPIRTEKAGTAPPSADVKKGPTPEMPKK